MKRSVLAEEKAFFSAGGIRLEGLLYRGRPGMPGAVVCHPHPLYGGDMHNNVVEGLVQALAAAGFSTLRFNFRGTGASEGAHGGGLDEQIDVRAAVDFLSQQSGCRRLAVCGYSFGAAVGAEAGGLDPRVMAIVAVALPIGLFDAPALLQCQKPKLLVAGGRDQIVPLERIEEFFRRLSPPKDFFLVEDADHFFRDRERQVAGSVVEFLRRRSSNVQTQ